MSQRFTGGCLCTALRYTTTSEPQYMGYCCCDDCQKASGSGFVPFVGFAAGVLEVTGPYSVFEKNLADGRISDRFSCTECSSLVFGGRPGAPGGNTVYAGSLDDPALFKPTVAIMTRFKPDWVILPDGITLFDGMPR